MELWAALGRSALARVARWLPGWVLRASYPPVVRRERLLVFLYRETEIWGTAFGSPVLSEVALAVVNQMPFKCEFRFLSWEVAINGATVGESHNDVRWDIRPNSLSYEMIGSIRLDPKALSNVVKAPSEIVHLVVKGHARIACGPGEFDKYIHLTTACRVHWPSTAVPIAGVRHT